jgi:hypothetical protein
MVEVMRLPEKGVKMLLRNATKKNPLEYPSHNSLGFLSGYGNQGP